MAVCHMEFTGKLLKRGFWLYVWDVKEDLKRHLYVGRTGDTSSPNASSPFRRIGQHLDFSMHAKGNALGRQLKSAKIDPESCTFELTAIGPIFDEQQTMSEHKPLRHKTAALERALADELRRRGYHVLGAHPRPAEPDRELMAQVSEKLSALFPDRTVPNAVWPRFAPVQLKGNVSVCDMLIQDRADRCLSTSLTQAHF